MPNATVEISLKRALSGSAPSAPIEGPPEERDDRELPEEHLGHEHAERATENSLTSVSSKTVPSATVETLPGATVEDTPSGSSTIRGVHPSETR